MNEEDLLQRIRYRILSDTTILLRYLNTFEIANAGLIRDWRKAETLLKPYRDQPEEQVSLDKPKGPYEDYLSLDYPGDQVESDSPFAPLGEGLILLRYQLMGLRDQRAGVVYSTYLSFQNVEVQLNDTTERLDLDASQIEDYEARSTAESAVERLKQAWSGLVGTIQQGLKKIRSRLATLLANYLNLKEWTISGDISTSPIAALFGLSASAGIEVTFEP